MCVSMTNGVNDARRVRCVAKKRPTARCVYIWVEKIHDRLPLCLSFSLSRLPSSTLYTLATALTHSQTYHARTGAQHTAHAVEISIAGMRKTRRRRRRGGGGEAAATVLLCTNLPRAREREGGKDI